MDETSPQASGNAVTGSVVTGIAVAHTAGHRTWSATERARECRRRKKDRLRLVPIEIFEEEIDAYVRLGILKEPERGDRIAVAHAVYRVIEAGRAALEKAAAAQPREGTAA